MPQFSANKKLLVIAVVLGLIILFLCTCLAIAVFVVPAYLNPVNRTGSGQLTLTPSAIITASPTADVCDQYKLEDKYVYNPQVKTLITLELKLQTFLDKYHMQAYVLNPPTNIGTSVTYTKLTTADLPDLEQYLDVFIREWSKYPADWIASTGVKGIVMVKNLAVDSQNRAAMPEEVNKVVFYDVSFANDETYIDDVIHHEFYHLVEYDTFGNYYYKDPDWSALNPAGFKYLYSAGTDTYTDPNYTEKEHPRPGFVSQYSMSALEEDKAETYAYIMDSVEHTQLESWVQSDPYLAQKVSYLENFMQSKAADMNQQYYTCIFK